MRRRGLLALALSFAGTGFLQRAFAQPLRPASIAELRDLVIAKLKTKPGVSGVVPVKRQPAVIQAQIGGARSTINVTNLFAQLNAYPDREMSETIETFIRPLVQQSPKPVDTGSIVPVLRTTAYVGSLRKTGVRAIDRFFTGDLSILYMVDGPDSMSPVSGADIGLAPANVHGIALANLEKWLGKMGADDRKLFVHYSVDGNEMLAPSLLLLDGFWQRIAPRFRGDVLIALPRRDQLFIFDASDPQAEAAARRLIAVTWNDTFNLLSGKLYRRRNGRIAVVEGGPAAGNSSRGSKARPDMLLERNR